jgi:biopolymer transport protein TolR
VRSGSGPDATVASADELADLVRGMAANDQPFAISASQELKYADVIKVADALHKAGIKRVALTVKQ